MRNDVQLLGDDRGRNALMPELTSVFKAVRDQGPMSRAQQIYFNAWVLRALLYHDKDTLDLLQARTTGAMTLALRNVHYASVIDYSGFQSGEMGNELDIKVRNIHSVLGVFLDRMKTAPIPIPFALHRMTQAAMAFNDDLDQIRAALAHSKDETTPAKLWATRQASVNPLIAATMAAYLMHTLGQHVTQETQDKFVQEKYSSHAQIVNTVVPLNFDMHLAGEAVCMDAVQVMRDIYKRVDELLWDQPPAFVPKDKPEVIMLLHTISSYTQAFAHAKKPEIAPLVGPADDNVISLFQKRAPR